MRVLWITNIPLPRICRALEIDIPIGGGWLTGLSEDVINRSENTLTVCFPVTKKETIKSGLVDGVRFYGVPCDVLSCKDQPAVIHLFQTILQHELPDIIHIWGTEYAHSYWVAEVCKSMGLLDRTVVSIQGLVSIIADYYYGNLPKCSYIFPTIKEVLRRTSLKKEKEQFISRGRLEEKCLKLIPNVIGRTDWDEACTREINPQRKYFKCNETLRNSFYNATWTVHSARRHSIFCSQAHYPIKGFHKVIEAVRILRAEGFQDIVVYTTGKNRNRPTLREYLSFSSYDLYLYRLIKKYNLENNVCFLGDLSEEEMCAQYLKSHVFVSASAIENSPNSLGEAMLLGVPTVASDVGGVKNMLTHGIDGYIYPFDDEHLMAEYIRRIFLSDELAESFSKYAKEHALQTHNRDNNYSIMMKIYETINS